MRTHSSFSSFFAIALALSWSGCGARAALLADDLEPSVSQTDDAGEDAGTSVPARAGSMDAGSDGGDGDGTHESGSDAGSDFFSCASDQDCVVAQRVGCCNNGWRIAVRSDRTSEYARSYTCPVPSPICLMYLVRDMRVARCDLSAHACALVDDTP